MKPATLPESRCRNTLANLTSGESGIVQSYSMMVEPNGDCYVDQHTEILKDVPLGGAIIVTKHNQGCTVDLRQSEGHKWTPRPINFRLYTFDLWPVIQFVV